MSKVRTFDQNGMMRLFSPGIAAGVASFVTQPLQVMKTNKINSPKLVYHDLHKKIVEKGWGQYMNGSSLAAVRQAYGFILYTTLLKQNEKLMAQHFPTLNKYVNYSVSAVTAKLMAMIFEAPLTLLKTRVEKINSRSVGQQITHLLSSPLKDSIKGLGSSILREGVYTFFHYNTFRFLKDSVLAEKYEIKSTFIPAFMAGVVAITVSQPFEVIRSLVSLNTLNQPISSFALSYFRNYGIRGYFFGFVPRLIRKPINSGICWTIYQSVKKE